RPRNKCWRGDKASPRFGPKPSAISKSSQARGKVDDHAHGSDQRHQADGEENGADAHADPGWTAFRGGGDPMKRGHDEEHAWISAWWDQGAEQLLARGPGFRDPEQDRSNGPSGHQQDEREHLQSPEPGCDNRGSRDFSAAGCGGNVSGVAKALEKVQEGGIGLVRQAAALLRNVAANLVDDLVAAVRGKVGQLSLEPLQIFAHQLRGMGCGHHCLAPFRKMLSTESRNLNHSSRNSATAFWPERLSR